MATLHINKKYRSKQVKDMRISKPQDPFQLSILTKFHDNS